MDSFFVVVFKKKFLGTLVPLFWVFGDISSGFQSQSRFCLIHLLQRCKCKYALYGCPPLVLHVTDVLGRPDHSDMEITLRSALHHRVSCCVIFVHQIVFFSWFKVTLYLRIASSRVLIFYPPFVRILIQCRHIWWRFRGNKLRCINM